MKIKNFEFSKYMKNFEFSKYCTPAQLYLIIGVICIISGFFANYSVETLLTNALFLVIWAWILNWLCLKGFKAVSWIFVLLPFIFFLFTYFLIKDFGVVREGILGDLLARTNCRGNWMDPAFTTCIQNERNAAAAIAKQVQDTIAAQQKQAQELAQNELDKQARLIRKAKDDAIAAEKKKQEEAAAVAAAAELKKKQAEADAAAAAEKKKQDEAAAALKLALDRCAKCMVKKTRAQCTPSSCAA